MKNKLADLFDDWGLGWGCLILLVTIIAIVGLIFGVLCLEAWLVMLAWNYCVCAVFASAPFLPGFWVTFGLIFILNFFVGLLSKIFGASKKLE